MLWFHKPSWLLMRQRLLAWIHLFHPLLPGHTHLLQVDGNRPSMISVNVLSHCWKISRNGWMLNHWQDCKVTNFCCFQRRRFPPLNNCGLFEISFWKSRTVLPFWENKDPFLLMMNCGTICLLLVRNLWICRFIFHMTPSSNWSPLTHWLPLPGFRGRPFHVSYGDKSTALSTRSHCQLPRFSRLARTGSQCLCIRLETPCMSLCGMLMGLITSSWMKSLSVLDLPWVSYRFSYSETKELSSVLIFVVRLQLHTCTICCCMFNYHQTKKRPCIGSMCIEVSSWSHCQHVTSPEDRGLGRRVTPHSRELRRLLVTRSSYPSPCPVIRDLTSLSSTGMQLEMMKFVFISTALFPGTMKSKLSRARLPPIILCSLNHWCTLVGSPLGAQFQPGGPKGTKMCVCRANRSSLLSCWKIIGFPFGSPHMVIVWRFILLLTRLLMLTSSKTCVPASVSSWDFHYLHCTLRLRISLPMICVVQQQWCSLPMLSMVQFCLTLLITFWQFTPTCVLRLLKICIPDQKSQHRWSGVTDVCQGNQGYSL